MSAIDDRRERRYPLLPKRVVVRLVVRTPRAGGEYRSTAVADVLDAVTNVAIARLTLTVLPVSGTVFRNHRVTVN
jgi:hypothetical protein